MLSLSAAPHYAFGFQTCPMDTLVSFFRRPYQRLAKARATTTAENMSFQIESYSGTTPVVTMGATSSGPR